MVHGVGGAVDEDLEAGFVETEAQVSIAWDGGTFEVINGEVAIDTGSMDCVSVPEWAFAQFVDVWLAQRVREGSEKGAGERWGIEYKQTSLGDGALLTDGWESWERDAGLPDFVDESEALDYIAELAHEQRWFTSTRVDFRAVRLG